MINKFLLIILIGIFITNAYASSYPEKMSNRPLILSKGLWEIDLAASFTKYNSDRFFNSGGLYLRYGLSKNIELSLLGVKYNITKLSPKFQLAFRFAIPSFGYSDNGSLSYNLEGGVTGKYQINNHSFVMFDISEIHSHGIFNEYEFNPNVTYLYSFSNNLSFSTLLGIHKTTYLDSTNKVGYITMYYNYLSNLDLYGSLGYRAIGSLINTRYYIFSEKVVYGFGVLWRF